MAQKLGFVALALVALAVPFLSDQFIVYLLTQAFLYAVLAISLDLIWGYTGILNLGHSAYLQFPAITGGENGLFGFSLPGVTQLAWYYVAAIALSIVMAVALIFVRSDFGLLLIAIRDQERRASYLGFDVNLVKILIFALGAALAALAGGLYAMIFGLVSAPLFGFLFATEILVWVAIGGRGTIIGPALGAIAINLIGPQLNQRFPFQWQLLLGALFVAVVVLLPQGIIAPLGRLLRRFIKGGTGSASDLIVVNASDVEAQVAHAPRSVPEAILQFRDVQFSYGALQVLRGIDLEVRKGELQCSTPNVIAQSPIVREAYLGVTAS